MNAEHIKRRVTYCFNEARSNIEHARHARLQGRHKFSIAHLHLAKKWRLRALDHLSN